MPADGPLYRWPEATRFGQTVPKAKIGALAKNRTAVRERLTREVQRIVWSHKLAPSTVGLAAAPTVGEVQVLTVVAKADDVKDSTLRAIDSAIPYPVIFEIVRGSGDRPEIRMAARYVSRRAHIGATNADAYLATTWCAIDAERHPLPVAVDLAGLYDALMTSLLSLAPRPGERVPDTIARIGRARALEGQIGTLQRRLRSEPQFNRKVELRREIRQQTELLATLTDPPTQSTEDTSWTS